MRHPRDPPAEGGDCKGRTVPPGAGGMQGLQDPSAPFRCPFAPLELARRRHAQRLRCPVSPTSSRPSPVGGLTQSQGLQGPMSVESPQCLQPPCPQPLVQPWCSQSPQWVTCHTPPTQMCPQSTEESAVAVLSPLNKSTSKQHGDFGASRPQRLCRFRWSRPHHRCPSLRSPGPALLSRPCSIPAEPPSAPAPPSLPRLSSPAPLSLLSPRPPSLPVILRTGDPSPRVLPSFSQDLTSHQRAGRCEKTRQALGVGFPACRPGTVPG